MHRERRQLKTKCNEDCASSRFPATRTRIITQELYSLQNCLANGLGIFLLALTSQINPFLLVYVLPRGHGFTSLSTCLVSLASDLIPPSFPLYLCSDSLLVFTL